MVMSTGNLLGKWAVKNCSHFKAGNICKKPIKSMVQPTPDPIVPNPNASCAPGWVSREGLNYCYKVCSGGIHQANEDIFLLDLTDIFLNVFSGSAGVSRGAFEPEALVGRGGAFL